MIIKEWQPRSTDLQELERLQDSNKINPEQRKRIGLEIRRINSGDKGERQTAYELDFHFGSSKNYAVLHNLRIEHDGRVAQIDHLVITRLLEIILCESKNFVEGVSVNQNGEFCGFYRGKPYGVPSPIEQNLKHTTVLESTFRSGKIQLPKRLGLTLKPTFTGFTVISNKARISRPNEQKEQFKFLVKSDQLVSAIKEEMEQKSSIGIVKAISQETLEAVGKSLASLHTSKAWDWKAKFGIPMIAQETGSTSIGKWNCAECGESIDKSVASFCWFNKEKFGGKLFCREHQKNTSAEAQHKQKGS